MNILQDWGLSNSKLVSACFHGPPGTGKTTTAEAVAFELGLGIIDVNYAQLESKYHGETSKNIENIFEVANIRNAILFWDEADAVLSHRIADVTSSTDASINLNRTTMLKELDNFEGVVIFATNLPSSIDIAFRRRIRNFVAFEPPNADLRKKLLYKFLKFVPMDNDIIDETIVNETDGLSGSDLENVVLQAAIRALRLEKMSISSGILLEAIQDLRD